MWWGCGVRSGSVSFSFYTVLRILSHKEPPSNSSLLKAYKNLAAVDWLEVSIFALFLPRLGLAT